MFEPGLNLDWLSNAPNPLCDGVAPTLGSYRGHSTHLNVSNPQPGRHYAWGDRSRRDNMTRMRTMGFRPVMLTEPEGANHEAILSENERPSPLDSAVCCGNLVLMQCPTDVDAARKAARRSHTAAKIVSKTAEYEERGRGVYRELSDIARASQSGHAYFVDPRHTLEIQSDPR